MHSQHADTHSITVWPTRWHRNPLHYVFGAFILGFHIQNLSELNLDLVFISDALSIKDTAVCCDIQINGSCRCRNGSYLAKVFLKH